MTVKTQNISNAFQAIDSEQEVKNKLIEKILENMSGQFEKASSMEEISSIVSSMKQQIRSIVGNSQDPAHLQLLASLDTLIQNTANATAEKKIRAIIGNSQNPAHLQLLKSLDTLDALIQNNPKVAAENIPSNLATSIRSNTRKMTTLLSVHAEIKTLANANPPAMNGMQASSGVSMASAPPPTAAGPSATAAPPPSSPKSSSNNNTYLSPAPPLPPSNGPHYTDLNDPALNNWILNDQDVQIETALTNYYAYLAGPGMTDPTGMMNLMDFIYYLSTNGMMDAEVTDFLLDNGNLIGPGGGIELWTEQMSAYAFINGYGGYPPGDAARDAWIDDSMEAWSNVQPPNPFSEEVLRCLGDDSLTHDPNLFIDSNGQVYYEYYIYNPGPPASMTLITYYWDDTSGPFNDQDIIMSIINGQSPAQQGEVVKPHPFYMNLNDNVLAMEAEYRVSTLDALIAEFPDPIWAVLIFFMMCTDNQFQAQMSGHSRESDDLTEWTEYSTTLNQSILDFQTGNGTTEDTENFVYALTGGKVYVDEHPSVNGLDESFTTDVYRPIMDLENEEGQTIYELIGSNQAGHLSDEELTAELNAIFDSSPPTDGSTAVPNNNAQAAVNASNTFSSLVAGQSKNNVTIQATDASTEAALNKFGGSIIQMHSQMGNSFTKNQISR